MSKQDTPTPRGEDVVLTGASGITPEGKVTESYRANANLREGLMLVSYVSEPKPNGANASITLDRDRDGIADATFQTDAQGASYFTSGDKPIMRFSPEDSQRMIAEIRNIITYGGTDVNLYHKITGFLENPTPNGLPKVVAPIER